MNSKLVVFAYRPPPFHGQSYMVQLMIDGLGGDRCGAGPVNPATAPGAGHGIECHHVDCRYTNRMADVGVPSLAKVFPLFRYCRQAIRCHRRHGTDTLYYVPAPASFAPVLRDILTLFMLRPFFSRIILHWHAAGLGAWCADNSRKPLARLARRVLRNHDTSIVLSTFNREDVGIFAPKQIRVINNGIPDPAADFPASYFLDRRSRCWRLAQTAARQPDDPTRAGPAVVHLLYLGHLSEEKGLGRALNAVEEANALLEKAGGPRLHLRVAGDYGSPEDRRLLEPRLRRAIDLGFATGLGFIGGGEKIRELAGADFLLFPTRYQNENQPVVLLEAMSCNVPVITSRWRSLPEFLPPDYPWLYNPEQPGELTGLLIRAVTESRVVDLRSWFLERYRLDVHLAALAEVLRETPAACW